VTNGNNLKFDTYETEGFYDEIFEAPGKPRNGSRLLIERLKSFPYEEIQRRQKSAEAALFNMGVTFGRNLKKASGKEFMHLTFLSMTYTTIKRF